MTRLLPIFFLLSFTFFHFAPVRAYSDPLSDSQDLQLAFKKIESKDYKSALSILDRLSKSAPGSAGVFYGLGKVYQELGQNKLALEHYNKSLSIDSANPKAYSNRGLLLAAMGKLRDSITDFSKAIDLNPRYDHAYSNRGVAKGALGDTKGAIADFTKAITINPSYGSAWLNRGISHELVGDLRSACTDWRKAALLGKTIAVAWVKSQCN